MMKHESMARAAAALISSLAELGLDSRSAQGRPAILEIDMNGSYVDIEMHYVAYATAERVLGLVGRRRAPAGAVQVVVADRMTSEARVALEVAGWSWLDLRGRLHLRGRGLIIGTTVTPLTTEAAEPSGVVGRAGQAVAYWLCQKPGRLPSPTKDAPTLRLSPASITGATQKLRRGGLADNNGGLTPELFWELAEKWKPTEVWLAEAPDLDKDRNTATWRIAGNAAASAYGAPLVTRSAKPDTFYAAGPVEVDIAVRRYGTARPGAGAARVRVAAFDAAREWPNSDHEVTIQSDLVPLLTAALDLAQDRGRGREILDQWDCDARVW